MRTQEIIDRPPRTIMEVYQMLPEGTLVELINGVLYMSPSPVSAHQRVLLKITSSLVEYVEANDLGEIFIAPFDVYLDDHSNAVQPDIIFVGKEKASIVQDHIHGVPDLLIEILSPGSRIYDEKKKKELYEQFGVHEYWIIDPSTKETIGYTLQNGKYVEFFRDSGKIRSKLLNESFAF